jgi:hypothetical protein
MAYIDYGEDHPYEAGWLFGFLIGFATLITGCVYLIVQGVRWMIC